MQFAAKLALASWDTVDRLIVDLAARQVGHPLEAPLCDCLGHALSVAQLLQSGPLFLLLLRHHQWLRQLAQIFGARRKEDSCYSEDESWTAKENCKLVAMSVMVLSLICCLRDSSTQYPHALTCSIASRICNRYMNSSSTLDWTPGIYPAVVMALYICRKQVVQVFRPSMLA